LHKTLREIVNTNKKGTKATVNIKATIGHILDKDLSDDIESVTENEVATTTNK
jgi:hypothetical protein